MADAAVAIAVAVLAVGSVSIAYLGWRVLLADPRRLVRTPRGRIAIALMVLAAAAGLTAGIWLAERVQEGKEAHGGR